MSRFLCLPGLVAIKHPILVTMSLISVLLICLIFLTRLSFENDISKSFSSDSEYSQEYSELVSTLGFTPKQIIVLAESSQPFDLATYEALRELAFEFELQDTVSSVFSLASVKFPKNHANYPDASLMPVELDISEIETRLFELKQTGLKLPISHDRQSTLFVVSLADSASDAELQLAIANLKSATKQFGGDGVRFSFTGEDLIGPEMVSALQRDLIVNNVVGCSLAFVLALLIFGNLNLVIIAVLPALTAAVVSMATFTFLNFPINVLNTVIPILILVLALADSIHLTLHFRDTGSEHSLQQRIEDAVTTVGPACALTAITTAIAFAAIGVSGNQQLRELAIVGTLSVLLAYLAVIVSFVLLARTFGSNERQTPKRELLAIPHHWSGWILGNSKNIYVVCVVIVFASLVGLANVHPWFNLDENLPTNSNVRITNQKINSDFGGIYRIWSELDVSGDNELDTPEGWDRLVSLTKTIESAAPYYSVISLATLARWHGEPEKMPSKEKLKNLPERLLQQLYSNDNKIARVITVTPEAMLNEETLRIQTNIENDAKLVGAKRSVGLPVIMRHESISVIKQLALGLGIACLLSVLLVAVFYQWLALTAALLIPNALPLAVAAGSLALTHNGELSPTAMLALTVAFGIAIDDSIHLVNRFLVEKNNGKNTEQALEISIQKTGRAMLVTTVLICAGMLVTMLSSFETIRLFGGMLILTFVTAFLADILLLPCLLRVLANKK